MRIALIAPPYIPVPPTGYGGTERMLGYLAEGIKRRGLDITLFASRESTAQVPLVPIVEAALFSDSNYDHKNDRLGRIVEINKRTIQGAKNLPFDLVNTHDYENRDLISRLASLQIPVLVTIRHAKTPIIEQVFSEFRDVPNLFFQGLTRKQNEDLDPSLPFIHNGVDETKYAFTNLDRKNFILSLGDTKAIKGHLKAIELVKQSQTGLLIAGSHLHHYSSNVYFQEELKNKIDSDVSSQQRDFLEDLLNGGFQFNAGQVVYFGEVDDPTKKILFNLARCTQFLGNLEVNGNIDACPGVVLESIVSGTPVLGVEGSVTQELVDDGFSGYNVCSIKDALEKLPLIQEIAGDKVRAIGEERFSSKRMVTDYISLYQKILLGLK